MIRNRTIVAIAAAAVASLVLAGCGSSSSALNGSGGSSSGASAPSGSAGTGETAGGSAGESTGASGSAGGSGSMSGSGPSASGASSAGSSSDTDGGSASGSGSESSAPAGSAASGSSGEGGASGGPIVIGSGNFTESELVADIYAAALKAKGVDVKTKLDIGSREIYLKALKDGSINLLPEYTGGLLAYYDSDSDATAADDVYSALKKALPDGDEVLAMSAAQDQDSVTVTKKTADKYHLSSIGDLKPVAGKMTLGGSSEWQTRADGPKGLKKVYGVVFKDYKVLDPGGPLSVKGLKTGLVQATDIFTTNPAIAENDFVVLKDPKALFQAQNVVPLIAKKVASSTVTDALNAVSAKLTTKALTSMQQTIQDKKADPADVASKWVDANGLG